MNKIDIINGLESFKQRLQTEVVQAYSTRGSTYGNERFTAWRGIFSKFLDSNLPKETSKLNSKLHHMVFSVRRDESDVQRFWRQDGEVCLSFIDSLITDIKSDEYDFEPQTQPVETNKVINDSKDLTKVFIVHGHDELTKTKVARFIEQLGYEAIILHEQASGGKTIIEKIEACTNVGFAIVLYTPDDVGSNKHDMASSGGLQSRARQNVIFEHGYLIGKLGRDKVIPLVTGNIEMPSDVSGIVYVADTNWQIDIAKEMKQAGYSVDFNKLV